MLVSSEFLVDNGLIECLLKTEAYELAQTG